MELQSRNRVQNPSYAKKKKARLILVYISVVLV